MASTTTNLGLTKPAYSDDADISDINGNMDLIDAEAGKVRANVAANYDSSETYAVGDYCLHDGSLYKCSTAISSPEAWTAGHWTQIKITGELSALNGKIANMGESKDGATNVKWAQIGNVVIVSGKISSYSNTFILGALPEPYIENFAVVARSHTDGSYHRCFAYKDGTDIKLNFYLDAPTTGHELEFSFAYIAKG